MPEIDPADAISAQVSAYNARDLDAFLAVYADDVVLESDGKIFVSGKAAMRELYAKLFAENPGLHAEIETRRVEGDIVTDIERVTGRADGREIRATARYKVACGRILRVVFSS